MTLNALDTPLRRPWVVALVVAVLSLVAIPLARALAALTANAGTWRVFSTAIVLATVASLILLAGVRFADRREREPFLTVLAVLTWGALGATSISAVVSGAASPGLIRAFSGTPAINQAIASGLGFSELLQILEWLPTVFVAPAVEETVKLLGVAAAVWLLRGRVRGMRDGLVLGALVGAGFAIVETAVYVVVDWAGEGSPPYASEVLTRFALLGFSGHALWAALAGAGLGLARTLDRVEVKWAAVLAGWLAAIIAHALHNALGTPVIVAVANALGATAGEPTSIGVVWVAAAATWLIIEGPFMILMALCLISSGTWERDIIRTELSAEGGKVATPTELEAANGESIWTMRALDGMPSRVSKRLVRAQNRLALRRWSAERAGLDPEKEPGLVALREEILTIRAEAPFDPRAGQADAPTPR